MHGLKLVTPPAIEPVSLDEMRAWLRMTSSVPTDLDATVIQPLIRAAREWVEEQTERQLITATWRLTLQSFYPDTPRGNGCGVIRLPRPPLIEVQLLAYTDTDGEPQTVDAEDYEVCTDSEPGQLAPVYGGCWPLAVGGLNAVQVTYQAGYGALATAVPETLRTVVKMLAAHWFEHPEAVGSSMAEQPLGVRNMLAPYLLGGYG